MYNYNAYCPLDPYRMNECECPGTEREEKKEEMYKCITKLPVDVAVAMAYVPFQICNEVYDEAEALMVGTIFPVLNKPFLRGCCR